MNGPGRKRQGLEGNLSVAVATHALCSFSGWGPTVQKTACRARPQDEIEYVGYVA